MTRYAIDATVALEIVAGEITVEPGHQLVGPGRLRSDAMATLYEAVRAGALEDRDARARLDALASLKMRLLNDRASRAVAWSIAASHEWEDLVVAEYLAVARLQADALVATDVRVLAGASALSSGDAISLAPLEALSRA